MLIAIDGPAASGKGTLGRRIAAHYGLPHLDTGKLYRAVARDTLAAGHAPADADAALAAANALDPATLDDPKSDGGQARRGRLDRREPSAACREALRSPISAPSPAQASGAVHRRARHRHGHLPRRRREAVRHRQPRGRARRGAIASSRGRHGDDRGRGAGRYQAPRRTRQNRAVAPLRQAEDAYLLDTTNLDIDAAFKAAIALIDAAMGRAGQAG